MVPASNDRMCGAGRLQRLMASAACFAVAAAVALPVPPASAAGTGRTGYRLSPADTNAETALRGSSSNLTGTSGDTDPLVTTERPTDTLVGLEDLPGAPATATTQNPSDNQSADTTPTTAADKPETSDQTTGAISRIPAVSGTTAAGERGELGRINLRQRPIGQRPVPRPAIPLDQAPGIRIGTFTLRPELTQSIGAESQKLSGFKENRTYSQTAIRGTLTSDWSRHALTITGSGVVQKNISGTGETQPSADISADLRLDLAPETTTDVTAGYDFYRESVTDPNAVAGADSQSKVDTFTGGVALSRQLGLLRGKLSASVIRTTYSDVDLADGSTLSQADRDTLAGEFAARVGYELSPAIIPFVQAKYRRTSYDQSVDSAGYRRSSDTYTGEVGVATDFGEKLSGEIAAGYVLRTFEDSRLANLDGLAIDATGKWSPHRGTDVTLGLITQLEDSTTPGDSGPITYAIDAAVAQTVRENLVASLGARYLYRDYDDSALQADQQVYTATAGLSWILSRYLSLDSNVSFERTRQKGASDQDIASVDVGLTIRR